MKKAEAIGGVVGSIIGAIGTGIAIYFTGSALSSLIGVLGLLLGQWIGKSIDSKES